MCLYKEVLQNFWQDVLIIQSINRNNIKIKVYKKLLRELCEKYDGAEDFINDRIEEVCSHEELSAGGYLFFLLVFYSLSFLVSFFSIKIISLHGI